MHSNLSFKHKKNLKKIKSYDKGQKMRNLDFFELRFFIKEFEKESRI